MAIRFFDMFAGIGGFRSGLEAVGGFECIGHCEIDKRTNMAYCAIYDTEGEYYCDDARTINPDEMPDFDLLCAGFPCQSFSVAGKRLGFEDTRGTLFFEVARLLAAKRPAFFLLENVPGLLSHDGGKTLETIYAALIEMGYHFEWCVHNSRYFGVPQQRRRLYIVGYLDPRCAGQIFPLSGGNAAHDVIEDTAYTIDDLRKMGFSEEVLDALDLMTHDKNVPYMEYVAKISENEIARTVKLADLRHNSDLTRLDEIDDKARNRIEKYKAAIRLLSESKTSFCPYYDKGTDTWRVDFPDRDSEEGDLLYVASEYARTGLYYPYNVAVTAGKEYSGHAHSFEGVIQALLDDPAGFSIAGFEEFYSKQEQEMLLDIRNKLMNNIGEKASTAAKPDSSELL